MTQRRSDERGASAVEFALVMPILLMTVFAIISFGFLFAQDLALENAARQTARYGVIQGHPCDVGTSITQEAINAAAPMVKLTNANVQVYRGTTREEAGFVYGSDPDGDDDDHWDTSQDVCAADAAVEPCKDSEVDDNLYVRFDFSADVLMWVFPGMPKTVNLSSEGVFRCEFA